MCGPRISLWATKRAVGGLVRELSHYYYFRPSVRPFIRLSVCVRDVEAQRLEYFKNNFRVSLPTTVCDAQINRRRCSLFENVNITSSGSRLGHGHVQASHICSSPRPAVSWPRKRYMHHCQISKTQRQLGFLLQLAEAQPVNVVHRKLLSR